MRSSKAPPRAWRLSRIALYTFHTSALIGWLAAMVYVVRFDPRPVQQAGVSVPIVVMLALTLSDMRKRTRQYGREWRRKWRVPLPDEAAARFEIRRLLTLVPLTPLPIFFVPPFGGALPSRANSPVAMAAGAVALLALVAAIRLWRAERHWTRRVEAGLRGGPVCLRCTYPLRSGSLRCSECGTDWSATYAEFRMNSPKRKP